MSHRKKIPIRIARGILMLSGFKCCLCGSESVQIHHIDGNPNNNEPVNLIALCLPHHDRAEQGKSDASSLSLKLTPEALRHAKKSIEQVQAKRHGKPDVATFWASYLSQGSEVNPGSISCLGVAFKTWAGWESYARKVGVLEGDVKERINFSLSFFNDEIWVVANAVLPGIRVSPVGEWDECGNERVLGLSEEVSKSYALASLEEVSIEKYKHSQEMVVQQLERKRLYEEVGVFLEYHINGAQKWPENDPKLQMVVWLQYVAMLWNYFHLLGEGAGRWEEIARKVATYRAQNKVISEWDISVWDGVFAEKIHWLITVIRGKSIILRKYFESSFAAQFGHSYDDVILEYTTNGPGRGWPLLVDGVKLAVSSLCEPSELESILNYSNPILGCREIDWVEGAKFKKHVSIDSAGITNTRPNYMQPAEKQGVCNLKFDLNDSYIIRVHPTIRPESIPEWVDSNKDLKITDVFKLMRQAAVNGGGGTVFSSPV